MHFSLILATINRTEELKRFLNSLDVQTYRDFELIIVDQNPDTRLTSLLEPYQDRFPIVHLHRPQERGVARARNASLRYVKGDVVTCPDDDCWYPHNLLEQVTYFLNEHPKVDGVSGRAVSDSRLLSQHPHNSIASGFLNTPLKVLQIPGPWCLFLRTHVIRVVGEFDETLGPGAGTPWGTGEDTDYYLRIWKAGFNLYRNPDLVVFHPAVDRYFIELKDLGRSYRYGAGLARVWRRHRLPLWYFIYELGRSLGGVLLSLLQGRRNKTRWHWNAFRGKLKGWLSD